MQGYDYGVRPVIAVAGDWSFVETWNKSEYIANVYGFEPQYGLAVNVPFVAMVFENEGYGRKLFEDHFLEWVNNSDDGDAVGIDFIEWKDGHYTIVVYPDMDHLIERLGPKHLTSDDVQVTAFVPAKGKDFTSKEGFSIFKEAAKNNVILLTGATRTHLFEDCMIRKLKVNFYEEGKIPQNSMSIAFERGRGMDSYSRMQPLPKEDISYVRQRRHRTLSRYFPVTLERIRVHEKFLQLMDQVINSNYEKWQVIQAFCNLSCSLLCLGSPYFEGLSEDTDMASVYHLLESYFETPNMDEIPQKAFDKGMIVKQIMLDSSELLRVRQIPLPKKSNPKTIQSLLRTNGLL
jgi:hypothetical protein